MGGDTVNYAYLLPLIVLSIGFAGWRLRTELRRINQILDDFDHETPRREPEHVYTDRDGCES